MPWHLHDIIQTLNPADDLINPMHWLFSAIHLWKFSSEAKIKVTSTFEVRNVLGIKLHSLVGNHFSTNVQSVPRRSALHNLNYCISWSAIWFYSIILFMRYKVTWLVTFRGTPHWSFNWSMFSPLVFNMKWIWSPRFCLAYLLHVCDPSHFLKLPKCFSLNCFLHLLLIVFLFKSVFALVRQDKHWWRAELFCLCSTAQSFFQWFSFGFFHSRHPCPYSCHVSYWVKLYCCFDVRPV